METLLGFKISDWGLTLCSDFFFGGEEERKDSGGDFLWGFIQRQCTIFCRLFT